MGIKAFVTAFLFRNDQVLLLRRADDRAFAPGLWTGVGGKVAAGELGDLFGALLREVCEETGFAPEAVHHLKLDVVLTQPEGGDVVVLAFFSGDVEADPAGDCGEGMLHWIDVAALGEIPMIANARCALEKVLAQRADAGVCFGVCDPVGPRALRHIAFAPNRFSV